MRTKGIMKKTIAVILGITMAFGGLMLPGNVIRNEVTAASAYYEANGCQFEYSIETDRGVSTLKITGIKDHGETVEIPSVIIHEGIEYPVYKIDDRFLDNDKTVKTVIFPESVKIINTYVLYSSSVEDIVLPDGLEHLGTLFAAGCPNLKSVKYNGTSMQRGEVGWNIFSNSNLSGVTNEKGAVVLGNWLIRYNLDKDLILFKPSDLGTEDIPIENIATGALRNYKKLSLTTLDLEGIKYIGSYNFKDIKSLTTLQNTDDLEYVDSDVFSGSAWYENANTGDILKIGKMLMYYKTDSNILDFTKGELAGIKAVGSGAFDDCKNIDTIICTSDCDMSRTRFNVINEPNEAFIVTEDPFPIKPKYNIKKIVLDGKEITYQRLIEDPDAHAWMKQNIATFKGSVLVNKMIEEKTKELFKELDITYYGMDNDKIGTLTPTEEFYIRLKITNYISEYDYDHLRKYNGMAGGYLLGGKVRCTGYAELTHYLLECAGVEAKTFISDSTDTDDVFIHFWNATKLGGEWFVSDDGWSAQDDQHNYDWFLLSYNAFYTGEMHKMMISYDSFHYYPESRDTEEITVNRTFGDLDGDDDRDQDDVTILWDHIKGSSSGIDMKHADINLDGNVNVTDAVLLDHMVNGKALDVNNIPIDGLAPGVCVAFLNGDDYDNIKYVYTERGGYITLPDDLFEAPEGKKISYDAGMAGQKVRITTPLQIVNVKWIDDNGPDDSSEPDSSSKPDSSEPDSSSKPDSSTPESSSKPDSSATDSSSKPDKTAKLGDVNGDGTIDVEDAVAIIQHINGVTPLTKDEETRADVSRDSNIDIDDAVMIISYINGNSTF